MTGISKEERSELLRAIKVADENFKKGMYALAEPTYRKGVEFLGDGAPEITGCLQNLAQICSERKDFNEALKLDIHLLLLSEERFGEDHAKTIGLMDEIAGLYEKLGRTDESRDMYERARKASERSIWADQSNEPELTDDDDGVPDPQEIAKELGLGYQYSDTAKSNLEIGLPKPGEIAYEFSSAPAEPKKRDLSEETMKLPKLRDDQIPPQKDPQLETLILDKVELKKSMQKDSNGKDGAGASSVSPAPVAPPADAPTTPTLLDSPVTPVVPPQAAPTSEAPSRPDPPAPTSDILKKMKSKLNQSLTTTVVDPKAPILETPEVIGVDAIKPGDWKSDAAMSKVVLGDSLKKQAKEKVSADPTLVESSPAQEKMELERADTGRTSEVTPKKKKEAVETKLFQSDKQRKWILGIFMGGFLMLLVASLFTSHANTQEDFRSMAHRYRTVDGEKLFFLTSPSECEFVAGADSAKMPYYQHHGDLLDTCRIMFGPLLHHPHWLTKVKNGLIDEQGSTMYAEASPELGVADFAEEVGKAAQLSYLKTKHYPKKLEEIDSNKRAYHNPFSGQLDKLNIQSVALGKKTQADDGGQRKKLYDITVSGNRWPNEVKRHAGGINCYSVVIHTKKGDINTFYIRPFDRESKPFISSQPDTAYAIVLENGVAKSPPRPHLTFVGQPAIRPHRAWLMPVTNSSILFFLRHGAAIIFALVAFASWILAEAIRKNNLASTALKGVMGICLILMVVYLLSGVLP
ncbi:MAG: tetratricopeptide repeat protein [Cyanobacteria bacterium SZAS-4]|nr:tetratricopeptide repeat protein [Cyanobacteria bacterium SZAS-4]